MKERSGPAYLPDQKSILELEKYGKIRNPFKSKTSQNSNKPITKQSWKKPKKIYDKQNLLDMIKKEKNKKNELQYQNEVIKEFIDNLTIKKQLKNQNQSSKLTQYNKKKFLLASLQEQIAILRPKQIELTNEIARIKKSKKYTKFMETKAELIECQQQLNSLKDHMHCYRKENYKVKRMIKQARFRNQDLQAMNNNLQIKSLKKKQLLQNEIELLNQEILSKKKKKQQMEKVKKRVLEEISELKHKCITKKQQFPIQKNAYKGILFRNTPNCKISATYCCQINPISQEKLQQQSPKPGCQEFQQSQLFIKQIKSYTNKEFYTVQNSEEQPDEQSQEKYQNQTDQYQQSYGWTINCEQEYQEQSFNDEQDEYKQSSSSQSIEEDQIDNKLSIDQRIQAYSQSDYFTDN